MKNILTFILFLAAGFNFTYSQVSNNDFQFPQDWLGNWEGTLTIYSSTGKQQELPMMLKNSATENDSIFNWVIVYGQDSLADERNYLLKVIHQPSNHYVVDEQNGIILDGWVFDNEFVSIFDVMGNQITTRYKRNGEYMDFDIIMNKIDIFQVSGDTIINGENIPEVNSYRPLVSQKARLTKVE